MLKALIRSFGRSRTGAVAVEFAVITPVVVVLTVGAWDIGRLINTTTSLTNLSRSGLQYAMSKYWDAEEVRDAVLAEAARQSMNNVTVTVQATCQCSDGSVPADCASTNACGGTEAVQIFTKVSASKSYGATIPFPGITTSTSFTRSSKVRVR